MNEKLERTTPEERQRWLSVINGPVPTHQQVMISRRVVQRLCQDVDLLEQEYDRGTEVIHDLLLKAAGTKWHELAEENETLTLKIAELQQEITRLKPQPMKKIGDQLFPV